MAHEEQRDCSLAEDTSLEAQNSPLDPENKDGTAEVEVATVDVAKMTDTSGEDIACIFGTAQPLCDALL